MSPEELDILDSNKQGEVDLLNPFPGLRPFTFDESHLFFGREGQSDDILLNLAKHRFTAVIGTSGSGKSSLMFCGIVPILYGGFMTDAGSDWSIMVTRPGIAPIENLAETILKKDESYVIASEDEKVIQKRVTSTILRSSSMGLVDTVKDLSKSSKKNIFILIDQFEELFRYIGLEREDDTLNESSAYVNLLLKAISQSEVPIYIAFTMRSDFIGDCSQFPELTSVINKSHYLVPQMTRDQQRMAIEGPVAVGGGKITKRLVQQLLNDVGNNPDQLPVMQHALMRTWDYWVTNMDAEEPIDLRHYIAIGKINEALSQHANEAYSELDKKEKEVCEVLFKALTEKGADNKGVRRAAKLREIVDISGVREKEIINIIEKFREPGRSLLTPAANIKLNSSSVIEISHESLMRIWQRLKKWVDEEAVSAQMYKRLSDAAEMYQVGKTGLWRPPDLHLALNWQKKQKPTISWALRYNPFFERAVVFLDTSKTAYESEQKSKEHLQKQMFQRTKMVAFGLGIAFLIAIIFGVFGLIKKIEADNQREEAFKQSEIADQNRIIADENAKSADYERGVAEKEKDNALESANVAIRQTKLAQESENKALVQQGIAEARTIEADSLRGEAVSQSIKAIANADEADRQTLIANEQKENADNLRMISIAQSMAVKSLNIPDANLKASLALQAYKYNKGYGGKDYDNYIYDGLYYAKRDKLKQSLAMDIYQYAEHRDMLRSIVYAPNGMDFYTTGSDGKILKWDGATFSNETLYNPDNNYINYDMSLSSDGKWLAVGGDAPYMLVINLQELSIVKLEGHTGLVTNLMFLPDSDSFLSYGIQDRTLRINNAENSKELKKFDDRYTALSLNKDGRLLIAGNENGSLDIWDVGNMNKIKTIDKFKGTKIYSIEFSPDGKTIVVGNEDGVVYFGSLRGDDLIFASALPSQQSRINTIKFSPDGKLLATASLDGTVQLWVISEMDKMLPVVFKDHKDYVWTIEFSHDNNYLLAGTKTGVLKLWPTKAELIAEDMCKYLYKNMDQADWDRYVGEDIEYEETCEFAGKTPPNK